MLAWLWLACGGPDTDSGTSTDPATTVTETGSPTDSTSPDSGSPSGTDSGATGPTDSDSGTSPTPSTLVQHGQVTCADPSLREGEPYLFADHGQDYQRPDPEEVYMRGSSVAVEDFDGDGHWDVLVGHTTYPMLFRGGPDGQLTYDALALPDVRPEEARNLRVRAMAAADIDGDGDPDLVMGTVARGAVVLRNDGATFTDVTDLAGLHAEVNEADTIPLGDLDGDGDLDLMLGHNALGAVPPEPGEDNYLYENQGDGTFVDISDRLLTAHRDGYTQVCSFVDLDVDGDQDLYIANHRSTYRRNFLLLNDGTGQLSEDPDAGLDISVESMGTSIADLNDDGLPDLLISGWGEMSLMESVGTGIWARTEKVRELIPDRENRMEVAWGNALGDLDNDGDLDIVIGYGPANLGEGGREGEVVAVEQRPGALVLGDGGADEEDPEDQPDAVWLREDEVFVEVGQRWGLRQERDTRGVIAWDFDGDGWLDILKTAIEGKALLFTARCGEAAWITLTLDQGVPNPRAYGAVVTVEAGGQTWRRWLTAGSTGYVSFVPPQVHFGLGDVEVLDALSVTWPDGTVDTFTDVPTRQALTVVRGAR